jgi:type IV secretory pathway VirD2 relaxase
MRIVRMTSGGAFPRRSATGSGFGVRTHGARQRCAVRISYSSNRVRGQWSAHGRYLLRESATQSPGATGLGFGADEDQVDIVRVLARWQNSGDPRLFKLIISPEFGERLDLRQHTRALMGRVEHDLALDLEWVAVAHFNTDHPHVHVALRGVAGGAPLRFERDYIKRGIRKHAEDLCTEQLGFRTPADAIEAERREVALPRWTSLDARIRRAATAENAGDGFIVTLSGGAARRVHHLAARLRTLERLGLAECTGLDTWSVRHDFEAALKSMQRVTDRQRMLAEHGALLSDPRLPLQYTRASDIDALEGRVLGHSVEEASGAAHMLLEGTDAKVHLIPHTEAIQAARGRKLLAPNSFVRLQRRQRNGRLALQIHDFGDAEAFLESRRFRRAGQGPPTEVQWGGWLGRFLASTGSVPAPSIKRNRTAPEKGR